MIQRILICFVFVFFGSTTFAEEHAKTYILKKIHVVEADPVALSSQEAYKQIIKFAFESSSVKVVVSEKILPWFARDTEYKLILFGSFIAGNIKGQLIEGRKQDDSYSGVLCMIKTYKQIKTFNESFYLAEIDRLIYLEKEGLLRDYVRTVSK